MPPSTRSVKFIVRNEACLVRNEEFDVATFPSQMNYVKTDCIFSDSCITLLKETKRYFYR